MKNYRLYYDINCPLCVTYTKWFVKWKMLPDSGRIAFSEIESESVAGLNVNRARNEIALVEGNTGQVFYGIDSLIELLNGRLPFVKPIAKFPPVYFFVRQLYAFISYNRKVIAGDGLCDGKSCTPEFNVRYRWAFIVLAIIVCGIISVAYLTNFSGSKNGPLFTKILAGYMLLPLTALIILKRDICSGRQRLHLFGSLWAVLLAGNLLLLLPMAWITVGLCKRDAFLMVYWLLVMLWTIYSCWQRIRVIKQINAMDYPL